MNEHSPAITRRSFSRMILGASSAAVLGRCSKRAVAAQPIARNGSSHLKLSLAAYSFHRYLPQNWPTPQGHDAEMSLLDFIDFCAAQNLDGCELTSYYFPAEITHEYLMQVKERAFRLGLDISGTAIGNDFCLREGPERDAQLALTRQWIDYAAEMGAPVIRIFAGSVPAGDTEDAALQRCVDGINLSLAYAAQKGVALALENHGGITATPEQLLAIVERVDESPWFGVNFDSGNFHTDDPYAALEMIAPYTINAQLKVSIHPAGGERQPADLGRIVDILRSAGYRGYVVLEYEERNDPRQAVPLVLKELRSLISA